MTIPLASPKRPDCKHEPRDLIAAFYHICRGCGLPIAPMLCEACDGTGDTLAILGCQGECTACSGTGVERWKATL